MRFKIIILSSMLFIAFLAMTALSADWESQQTQTADQLLDGGETIKITPPPGQAATPQLSRDAQKNKSSQKWDMPNTLSGSGKTPWASRDQAEAASSDLAEDATSASQDTTSTEEVTPAATSELPPAQTVIAASLGGSWSFTLNDSVKRDLALTLFQKENDLFGAGKIREGNNTLDVTVSGSVQQDETVKLDVTTTNPISLYKLNLTLNGDMASGEYQGFSPSGDTWKGTVEGQKTA